MDFCLFDWFTLDIKVVALLIASGIIVGIINTLAGGGSIITMTMLAALGLDIHVANGTNRVVVLMQNLTATLTFLKKGLLNLRDGALLSIPVIIGNIIGSMVATTIDEKIFKICFGVVLVLILLYIIFDNHRTIKDGHKLKIKPHHYLLFLAIGFYGGYIYIGIGYMILAITLWSMKMDIVTANAIKGFVIFVATPFSLLIFILNDQVEYSFGIIHGIGNIIGSFFASHYAIGWGKGFIKCFTAVIVLICFADLLGLISLHDIFYTLLGIEE